MENRVVQGMRRAGKSFRHLTALDVLRAHTQFGPLNYQLVRQAMGPNWPEEWNRLGPGQGIFAEESAKC